MEEYELLKIDFRHSIIKLFIPYTICLFYLFCHQITRTAMVNKIFVAATGQHKGKTTSTLGLVAVLKGKGYNVGYCKPVGQKSLTVDGKEADKDTVLFSKMIGFQVEPEIHSPVILGKGATSAYLDHPEKFDYVNDILNAAKKVEAMHDVVVYEGTGHPGVGSVVDLSNAQVARLLNAGVVMVVEGGIGNTIDRLNLSLGLFREQNVPILGVIINKVIETKIDTVKKYVGKKLEQMNIPLLGLLPYDPTLSFPIIATVSKAVNGKVMFNQHKLNNQVADIMAGSLVDFEELKAVENSLLVVSYKRFREACEKIKAISSQHDLAHPPISGVLITGDGRHETWYREQDLYDPYLQEHEIPVVTTALDTYGSVVKISRIEVKINTSTPWKVKRAIELINKHVDMEKLLKS